MNAPECPRLFEVEAARDGRLTGRDLARFQSHLARCPRCREEARALDALGESLRALPAVTTDELHARRERTRLLAAFDASLVRPAPHPRRWLIPVLAVAALCAIALAFTLWNERSTAVAPTPAARDPISIRPSPGTEWSRRIERDVEAITLTSGTLFVSVDHTRSPRRLRVLLPDGDLEDLGTTFTVSVAAGATTHVGVLEGSVILRLRDRPPVLLGANETWTPPLPTAPAAAAAASAPAPSPTPPPSAPAVSRRERAARDTAGGAGSMDTAASDFRAALAALDSGNPSLAATLFATFLARHPTDRRREDAAYLRVIALQRAGNASATRDAARSYLRQFPNAFRRTEIEPLAR